MDNITVQEILQLRKQGLGYRVIGRMLDIKNEQVRYYCVKNGLGGFVAGIDKESNALEMFIENIRKNHPGFEYHSGFINTEQKVFIKCKTCCGILEKHAQFARKTKQLKCSNCIRLKREKSKKPKLKVFKRNVSNLKEVHIDKCYVCSTTFGTTDKRKKSCTKECAKKHAGRMKELKKRSRDKNIIRDKSISLEKLIEVEKNVCYLCGVECNSDDYYTDDRGSFIVGKSYPSIEHVIPISKGGSHTWENVRLAHHYCNTIKRDNETEFNTGQLSFIV